MKNPDLAVIAAALSIFGVLALRVAWGARAVRARLAAGSGAFAIGLALVLFAWSGQGERGIALGMLALMVLGLAAVAASAIGQARSDPRSRRRQVREPWREAPGPAGPHTRLHHAVLAIAMAAVSGATTLVLAIVVYVTTDKFDLAAADRVSLALLVWPLLWAILCADLLMVRSRRLLRTGAVALVGLAAWLGLVLLT